MRDLFLFVCDLQYECATMMRIPDSVRVTPCTPPGLGLDEWWAFFQRGDLSARLQVHRLGFNDHEDYLDPDEQRMVSAKMRTPVLYQMDVESTAFRDELACAMLDDPRVFVLDETSKLGLIPGNEYVAWLRAQGRGCTGTFLGK